ncbi:MAG: dual specificity protein phosphatase family protein [Thermoproteota archaeon]
MFKWIVNEKIAGASIPINVEDLQIWKNEGIKAVVLKDNKLDFLHSPIKDFHAPSLEQLENIINWINHKIAIGKPVVVHCHGGIGRTGIILAAYLVENGAKPDVAILEIKKQIPFSLELEEQINIVYKYYWKKKNI